MKPLLLLPDEILTSILSFWVGLADLTAIDTAQCNRSQRRTLLQLFARQVTQDAEHAYASTEHFHAVERSRRLNLLMTWIVRRGVRSPSIYMTSTLQASGGELQEYLQRQGKGVRRVYYHVNTDITRQGVSTFQLVCKDCPNVRHLTCARNFSIDVYRQVTTTWPSLESITVGAYITHPSLVILAEGLPRLTTMDANFEVEGQFERTQLVGQDWVQFTAIRGAALQHLAIAPSMDMRSICQVVSQCPQLHSLQLDWEFVDEATMQHIAQACPLLECVNLRGCEFVKPGAITAFAQCGRLRELKIFSSEDADNAIATAIRASTHLTALHIEAPILTLVMDEIALRCANLEELILFWWTARSSSTLKAQLSAIVKGCPRLRTLHLHNGNTFSAITDDVVTEIARQCPLLKSLALEGVVEVSDDAVTTLAWSCPWLRTVKLASVGITLRGMRAIAAYCRHMRTVRVESGGLVKKVEAMKVFPKCVMVSAYVASHG